MGPQHAVRCGSPWASMSAARASRAASCELATGDAVGAVVRLRTPDPATHRRRGAGRRGGARRAVARRRRGGTSAASGSRSRATCATAGTRPASTSTTAGSAHRRATSWRRRSGAACVILNDADAAALGEVTHGAAVGVRGVVVVLTFGTGIGSGILRGRSAAAQLRLRAAALPGATGGAAAERRRARAPRPVLGRLGGRRLRRTSRRSTCCCDRTCSSSVAGWSTPGRSSGTCCAHPVRWCPLPWAIAPGSWGLRSRPGRQPRGHPRLARPDAWPCRPVGSWRPRRTRAATRWP